MSKKSIFEEYQLDIEDFIHQNRSSILLNKILAKTYLENTSESSNKFYKIMWLGSTGIYMVVNLWGKVGGRSLGCKMKKFNNKDEAQKVFFRAKKSKISRGYIEAKETQMLLKEEYEIFGIKQK